MARVSGVSFRNELLPGVWRVHFFAIPANPTIPLPPAGVLCRRTFASSSTPLGPVVPSESALGIAAVINRKARVANEFADLRTNTEDLALGLEKYTVGDLLLTKSLEDRGTWLWCDENVPALEAVRTMTKANVGALLVMRSSVLDVDNDGVVSAEELVRGRWEDAVAGVLTERDYLRKVVAQNKDASTTAVGTIMTDKKLYDVAQTDTPVLEALRRMTEGRHRHNSLRASGHVNQSYSAPGGGVNNTFLDRAVDDVVHGAPQSPSRASCTLARVVRPSRAEQVQGSAQPAKPPSAQRLHGFVRTTASVRHARRL